MTYRSFSISLDDVLHIFRVDIQKSKRSDIGINLLPSQQNGHERYRVGA